MKNEVPIFEYHDLSDKLTNIKAFHSPYVLLKTKFFEQMRWLYQNEYQTLTIDDLLSCNVPEKSVILTFDDGHISNYKLAFPILKKFNFVATFFVVPQWVGKRDYVMREHILEMFAHGMKFESHSLTHPYILSLTTEEMTRELRESKEKIQDMLDGEVNHFSVPYGFYDRCLVQHVKEAGYKTIVTEDFGYHRIKSQLFYILPRFIMKSNIHPTKFKQITEGTKIKLLNDYSKAFCLEYLKKLLGFRIYIRVKSLMLRANSLQIKAGYR